MSSQNFYFVLVFFFAKPYFDRIIQYFLYLDKAISKQVRGVSIEVNFKAS